MGKLEGKVWKTHQKSQKWPREGYDTTWSNEFCYVRRSRVQRSQSMCAYAQVTRLLRRQDRSSPDAEFPVSIKVIGDYHNIGLFFDKLSRLSRIVNIRDIVIATAAEEDWLNASCTAITYRFFEAEEKGAVSKAAKNRKNKT